MHLRRVVALAAAAGVVAVASACSNGSAATPAATSTSTSSSTREIAVEITGGHLTEPEDNGRPVALIASALGVSPSVFREAFSHVSPAPGGVEPDPAQVTLNKSALLASLGAYGVTNDELDRVSNYYRYSATAGETWPSTPARAHAVVRDGIIIEVVVDDAGSGYVSAPDITIPGFPDTHLVANLAFTGDVATNGRIDSITLAS